MNSMVGFRRRSKPQSVRLWTISFPLTCLLLAACTIYRPLDPGELDRLDVALQPGDDVRIIMQGGEQIDLTISSIEADVIASDDTRVALSDVRTIETRTFSRRRAWIIAGAIAGALLLSIDYDDGDCVECFPVFP